MVLEFGRDKQLPMTLKHSAREARPVCYVTSKVKLARRVLLVVRQHRWECLHGRWGSPGTTDAAFGWRPCETRLTTRDGRRWTSTERTWFSFRWS